MACDIQATSLQANCPSEPDDTGLLGLGIDLDWEETPDILKELSFLSSPPLEQMYSI